MRRDRWFDVCGRLGALTLIDGLACVWYVPWLLEQPWFRWDWHDSGVALAVFGGIMVVVAAIGAAASDDEVRS